MNFKTAKMMTKYRVCMTFMSILLLVFHFVFLFSCGKLPEKTFAFSDNLRIDSLEHMAMDSIYRLKARFILQIVYMIPGLFYIGQL